MALQPTFAMNGNGRFAVDVGALPGTYYLRNWSLRQTSRRGLPPGETLESANLALVSSNETATPERVNDFLLFLVERDRHYLERILAAVREKAGSLVAGGRDADGLRRAAQPGYATPAWITRTTISTWTTTISPTSPGTGATGASATIPRWAAG